MTDKVTEHFTRKELACQCGCGALEFEPGFLDKLETLRVAYGHGMAVTSGCRCPKHNKAEGGHVTSMHLTQNPKHDCKANAVDVRMPNAARLLELVAHAGSAGWSVGLNYDLGFVHLDRRVDVGLVPVLWVYGKRSK